MPETWMDVDAAVEIHVNMMPLISDSDFTTIDETIAYNESGMDLNWNFQTTDGTLTQTNVTPTTGGDYDWAHIGNGIYKIEMTASGGASANNDTEGFGWFSGVCDAVLPWRGPTIGFRAAGLNNLLVDAAYSATRGLTGTAVPAAVADAAGGLVVSDAGGFDVDNRHPTATPITNMNTVFDGVEGFAGAYAGPRGPGVYLNDAAGNANTVNGVDGTWSNPVSTIAAAKTIADSLSVDRIYLVNDSAITLAATMADYEFVGIGAPDDNTIALASQDVDNSAFYNVKVTGVQGGSARALFVGCVFGTATLYLHARGCGFTDAATGVTFSNNDDNVLDQCYSMVPGNSAPILICSAANLDLSIRHYSGGVELKTLNPTATVSIETDGQVIFNADCNVNAAVTMRGMMSYTDNTAGMNSLTDRATIDALLDDGTTAYDRTTDSLQEIRDRGDSAWTTGGAGSGLTALASDTAQAGAAGTITLAAGESATSDLFNGTRILIHTGTGAGQGRIITDYDGGTKIATVLPVWTTNPDNTSQYEIQAADGMIGTDTTRLDVGAANLKHAGGLVIDTLTELQVFRRILALHGGNFDRAANVFTHYRQDGTTTETTETIAVDGSGRTFS